MEKPKLVIDLEVEGDTITSQWWTPEVKELFCSICEETVCDKTTCLIANPWCG